MGNQAPQHHLIAADSHWQGCRAQNLGSDSWSTNKSKALRSVMLKTPKKYVEMGLLDLEVAGKKAIYSFLL